MFKSRFNIKEEYVLYLIIGITFLAKIWAVFHYPFNEDELDYVRTAFLNRKGYIPFRDYIHISSPLFSYLLMPFSCISNPAACLFSLKILFLVLCYFSLIVYFHMVQKWFSKKIAITAAFIFNLSYIFYSQSLLIRPSTLLFPILLFCFYFMNTHSIKFFARPLWLSFVLALFILLDQRCCVLVFLFIAYGIYYNRSNWKIFFYTSIFVAVILFFLFWLLNPISLKSLIKLAHFFPYNRHDQTILNLFGSWRYDWIFILISAWGSYVFYNEQKKFSRILLGVIFYCFMSFFILSSLRPDTFGIYILPFICLFCAVGLYSIAAYKMHYKKSLIFFMLLFCVSFQAPIKKIGFISLTDQLEIIKIIHNNPSAMNVSRFSLNLYSDLFYPILRFEDDILSSVKNLDVEKEFYDMLLNTLSEFTPEKIIYSEKDDYAGYAVKHFIKQNYIRKSAYLYELKKKENKTVPRDYSRLMMDQMYKLLGEVPL